MRSREPPAPIRWYYRPVWVLVLLFLGLGPLGILGEPEEGDAPDPLAETSLVLAGIASAAVAEVERLRAQVQNVE